MADIQITQEVAIELNNFHNVDLFQRGYYQVRVRVGVPNKLTKFIECVLKEEKGGSKDSSCLFKAFVDSHAPVGISRTFEVYYKHEDVKIRDNFLFKVHMLVDGSKLESLAPQKLELIVDLYFTESTRRCPATPKSLEKVSSQSLDVNITFGKSFHTARPVLFDYFHLGAVNLTLHSCLVSVRQPWSSKLKSMHPIWNGKVGNAKQYCYGAMFGKSPNTHPNHTVDSRQKANASFLHRKLCLQLLRFYEQMLTFYHKSISFLPDYAQMRLSKVDIQGKLDVLNSEFDGLSTVDELYLRMGDDLYLLSTELSLLWAQFLEQFTFEEFLRVELELSHHKMRLNHMTEAFFTESHAWMALCTSHELSASQQTRMGGLIKNSLYYQLIPPLDLTCTALDGDNSNMPIVFENRYLPGVAEGDISKENLSMTVEENIVGEDFVDMNVSIEEFTGYVEKLNVNDDESSSSSSSEEIGDDDNDDDDDDDNNDDVSEQCAILEEDFVERKSVQLRRYSKRSISEEWDMSREKLRKSIIESPETDLTGPDDCEGSLECATSDGNIKIASHKSMSEDSPKHASTTNLQRTVVNETYAHHCKDSPKINSHPTVLHKTPSIAPSTTPMRQSTEQGASVLHKTTSKSKHNRKTNLAGKQTAKFFTRLENDESSTAENSPRPSLGEEALLMDMELSNDPDSETQLKSYAGATMIDDPPSTSDHQKPRLWSCFPAIKSGSKRNSYKMVLQSPPYMPVSRENTSRFQRAKENLINSFNFHGHQYRHLRNAPAVKPYFSEQVVATTENVHLVICVHGLDGNSGDLRLVKCYLEMALPRANLDFLMSEINQDDTFDDIDEMTNRLVREIIQYISEQRLEIGKLSFVGHSLGNIIIRNAVTHSKLFEYRKKLHTFLSLSGPHLGMQFHTSNLVSTGMWLIQKWKKAGSLIQLALNDSPDPRDTFMYRLSLTNGFQYFKNVLLVSSVQDHYVPFHSARVEMSKQAIKDNSEGGRVYKEMLDNIMNPLLVQEEVNIVKYSVYHPMASSANTFIGRAAHIAMLDSELFLEKFILVAGSKYFA